VSLPSPRTCNETPSHACSDDPNQLRYRTRAAEEYMLYRYPHPRCLSRLSHTASRSNGVLQTRSHVKSAPHRCGHIRRFSDHTFSEDFARTVLHSCGAAPTICLGLLLGRFAFSNSFGLVDYGRNPGKSLPGVLWMDELARRWPCRQLSRRSTPGHKFERFDSPITPKSPRRTGVTEIKTLLLLSMTFAAGRRDAIDLLYLLLEQMPAPNACRISHRPCPLSRGDVCRHDGADRHTACLPVLSFNSFETSHSRGRGCCVKKTVVSLCALVSLG
jgi:hypothetical protein